MGPAPKSLHFVLFPFMAQGHMIPMVDIGRLLAQRGVVVTIVTTPRNAARFEQVVARTAAAGLSISMLEVKLPLEEAGIPEGCESLDTLPGWEFCLKFFQMVNSQYHQVVELLDQLALRPSCIISDMCLFYTNELAIRFQVPRIQFHGYCSFCLLCIHNIHAAKIVEHAEWDSEYFTVPGLREQVKFKGNQVPLVAKNSEWSEKIYNKMQEAEDASYGVIVNSFEELEQEYVDLYRKAKRDKVWFVGPVSLSHVDNLDKAQRGNNKASLGEHECLRWLDGHDKGSVLYACLGSISKFSHSQLMELGLGLEASKKPFIWVIRGTDKNRELFEKWVSENGFEERIKGRGLLVRGWSPQLLILSHPSVGGFLTHCGWNSTVEGISSGVPVVTWPMFGDQFFNEKLVVQVLKVGVSFGVENPNGLSDDENADVPVKKEAVQIAVENLMDGGEEGEKRRQRVRELARLAKKAVEVGGSSHRNITLFIQDIMQKNQCKCVQEPAVVGPNS